MKLIGQYDSPFVRRVGIAMMHYSMDYEHETWSTFRDADKLKAYNPLIRVPTLVLDDGTSLLDSAAIIDYLDNQVDAGKALFARAEPLRHQQLRIASLATGLADKAVSMFYEKVMHTEPSADWLKRCANQIVGVLATLEAERQNTRTTYWFGSEYTHADIAVTCALRFLGDAHGGRYNLGKFPALSTHAATMEALSVFKLIAQEFVPPK